MGRRGAGARLILCLAAAAAGCAAETAEVRPSTLRVYTVGPCSAMSWPVDAPVSSPFGRRDGRMHDGIDLAVPSGTPVRAACDGVVAVAGAPLSGYGRMILMRHADGLVTIYAHNRELLVREGDAVARGQTIALSGATGRVTAPHLHFEVRQDARPRNPLDYLHRRAEQSEARRLLARLQPRRMPVIMDKRIDSLKQRIRDIPDFPKPGILFKDVTPLIGHGPSFRLCTDLLAEQVGQHMPELVVGIESRGFIFGAALAERLGVGFVPVRKPGKLPFKRVRETYALEYGTDALEMHEDAVEGRRCLIVDDLLATGGTAAATARLVERQHGKVDGFLFVVELAFLNGRDRLAGRRVESLVRY